MSISKASRVLTFPSLSLQRLPIPPPDYFWSWGFSPPNIFYWYVYQSDWNAYCDTPCPLCWTRTSLLALCSGNALPGDIKVIVFYHITLRVNLKSGQDSNLYECSFPRRHKVQRCAYQFRHLTILRMRSPLCCKKWIFDYSSVPPFSREQHKTNPQLGLCLRRFSWWPAGPP